MGVNGLWTVVQPCARPTNLATLNRKRLAVDASIWIYQFLKAVRDKEGNALRNSHVVGFFRRICKLLWFGIQPVFVFDGGAPALKRATIQKRQRRREGRRDDALRTAGKLLAVQMQRVAEEEEQKRKRERERPQTTRQDEEEPMPEPKDMVYLDEVGMSHQERQRNRKFHKKDAYHLPELDGGIASMGKPDDPRIMSVEELEEYARQFNNGEDINLYDFSKIDFDGEFFKSLPPPDRYNILNAARLRSRLRMGLSKDQLDDMFPDRMAFSRFQIERVKERNHLTQRLMYEVGMSGTDLTLGVNARVAGEKDREYILVKNEGAEGGWALGVVSKEKDIGEAHKPIDVDAIEIQYQTKEEEEEDDGDDFEDVPIEGLNRLPKYDPAAASLEAARDIAARRQQFYDTNKEPSNAEEGSLFVGGPTETPVIETDIQQVGTMHPEEEDDLNRAIALSLQNQHGMGDDSAADEDDIFEEVPVGDQPEWTQRAVDAAKPLTAHGGSMIAHIVNNRSNAAVPKRQDKPEAQDSDSDEDMQAIMARSRKAKKQAMPPPRPVLENKKNPFDGPLPFPKLSWGSSLFGKSKASDSPAKAAASSGSAAGAAGDDNGNDHEEDDMAGGFAVDGEDKAVELPPWMVDHSDIRESLQKQRVAERVINAQDREDAEEEQRKRRKEMQDRLIEIESDSDNDSDIQIIEVPPSPEPEVVVTETEPRSQTKEAVEPEPAVVEPTQSATQKQIDSKEKAAAGQITLETRDADSPEPEFEDVELPDAVEEPPAVEVEHPVTDSAEAQNKSAPAAVTIDDDELFGDADENEYSDPEEEELLVQLAEEAEEHARFASELNQKSLKQNRKDYEQELKQLRTQQQKDRRDADEVTQVMVSECQSLLRLFGIPYITAPMEAEAQCAELVRLNIVDGIVTDDSDTFLFGGTRVYKNMFNSNKFVECYLGNELEKDLSLGRQQLISLAHLLGSDYTEGLPGVGPVTAVEIISEFPGKDGLSDFRTWWDAVQSQTRSKAEDASSPFRKKFRRSQATKLFLPPGFPNLAVDDAYLNPEVDNSAEPFQWGVPDLEGLRQFLMATIGWSKERTDEVLVPVIRDMNKREVEGTQSNITRFFGGAVGAGAREAFAPRQTAGTSKRIAAAVDRLRQNTAADGRGAAEQGNKRQRR